jgi:hypothetical protein
MTTPPGWQKNEGQDIDSYVGPQTADGLNVTLSVQADYVTDADTAAFAHRLKSESIQGPDVGPESRTVDGNPVWQMRLEHANGYDNVSYLFVRDGIGWQIAFQASAYYYNDEEPNFTTAVDSFKLK